MIGRSCRCMNPRNAPNVQVGVGAGRTPRCQDDPFGGGVLRTHNPRHCVRRSNGAEHAGHCDAVREAVRSSSVVLRIPSHPFGGFFSGAPRARFERYDPHQRRHREGEFTVTTRRVLAFVVGSAVVAGMLAAVPTGAAPRGSATPPYEGITTVPLEHLGTTAALGALSGSVAATDRTRRETPTAALARLRPRIGAGGQVETVGPPIPDPPSAPDNAAVSRSAQIWCGPGREPTPSTRAGPTTATRSSWSRPTRVFAWVRTMSSRRSTASCRSTRPRGAHCCRATPASPAPSPWESSHNEWFGFPPAIDVETGEFGPFTTDPSCYYDRRLGPLVPRGAHDPAGSGDRRLHG